MEPIDISVDPSHIENTSPSEPPTQKARCSREEVCVEVEETDTTDPDEFCRKEHLEKGREKEGEKRNITEENNLIAGGRQAPVINSPVNSYKHFPREVTFEDKLRESKPHW